MTWSLTNNMRALIFFEPGTEITEFFAPVDILHRAGVFTEILTHDSNGRSLPSLSKVVDNVAYASEACKRLENGEYDVVIIPGGKLGVKRIKDHYSYFDDGLLVHHAMGKLIAAICAAPSILGEMGILKEKKYTCYPGWESSSFGGTYTGKEIEIDKNLITARSMYYSTDFGLAIVEYLLGKEKRIEIERQVKGIK